jgi:uncharacterized protein with FMN-binding domain
MRLHTTPGRVAGLAGLLAAVAGVVAARSATLPSTTHTVNLAGGRGGGPATTAPGSSTTVSGASTTASAATPSPGSTANPGGSGSGSAPATPSATEGPSATPTTTKAPATTTATRRTIDGQVVEIPYGPIQVSVTFDGTRIVDVKPLEIPQDGRSLYIASQAMPMLRQEVLAAQSAQIDVISGASWDSQAYAQSVQSAIDKARG